MQGKATFRGHPVHLMLIPFPVAFWTGALLTDGAGVSSHDAFWFRMSAVLIAAGTVGAVVASVAGYVDYRTAAMSRRAHGVATGHMLWSLATLAVFALAWWLRATIMRHAPASPQRSSALLFVAGYLGSELANRYRVGISDVSPPERDAIARRAKRRR